MWFAAPSSPNAGGTGSWTANASLAKASLSCASVAGHSWLRCGMVRRLATVRWQLPSAVSGAGETVAALAAHIAEADIALAARTGSASLDRRCRAPPATRGRAADAARKCPGQGRARGWRASCRCPAARPRAAATPGPRCASRRDCRGSARHNCGSGPMIPSKLISAQRHCCATVSTLVAELRPRAIRRRAGRWTMPFAGAADHAPSRRGSPAAGPRPRAPCSSRLRRSRRSWRLRASRIVRIESVGAVTVGPPSKMST